MLSILRKKIKFRQLLGVLDQYFQKWEKSHLRKKCREVVERDFKELGIYPILFLVYSKSFKK